MSRESIEAQVKAEWRRFLAWTSSRNTVNWMFRGQGKRRWSLLPKVGRPESHRFGYNFRSEWMLLQEFKKSAVAHLNAHHLPQSELQWMVLAQHHGLPTRLLDWTKSPFIAALFALQNDDDKEDSAVYAIDIRRSILFDHSSVDPFRIPSVGKIIPSIVSDRIIAQQGIFTIHPQPDLPLTPPNSRRFGTYVFPGEIKKQMKTKLVNIGVNWHSLFLNLEGLSDHLTFMNRILIRTSGQFDWTTAIDEQIEQYKQYTDPLSAIDGDIKERKLIGDSHGEKFYIELRKHFIKLAKLSD